MTAAVDTSQMSSPFAGAAANAPNQPQDYVKLFKAEKENLAFSDGLYTWSGDEVEERVLRKYGKLA